MSSEQVRTGSCGVLARGSPAILVVLDEVLPYPKTPTPSHSHGRWRRLKVSSSSWAMTCVCRISVLMQSTASIFDCKALTIATQLPIIRVGPLPSASPCVHAVTKGFAP